MIIFDLLINILTSFVGGVALIFPAYSGLPSGVATGIAFFQPYWNAGATLFPLQTLFTILILCVPVIFLGVIWKFLTFLWELIPGN